MGEGSASGTPESALLGLQYDNTDQTVFRPPLPIGHPRRVPMDGCPHDWSSVKRRTGRQVPLIEFYPVARRITDLVIRAEAQRQVPLTDTVPQYVHYQVF